MSALYFLIPMSLLLLGGAVAVFLWSLRRGQYEDLESPAHRVIIEDREEQVRLDEAAAAKKSPPADSGPDHD
ncbi:MAG: cbb3-type cytochrome oxidase assembly protein CcoS [Pseudomonadota bacterium]